MDPLTHTLAALTLSRAVLRRPAAQTTLTLLLAANVSDLDYFYALGGGAAFYQHHHGWTHSVLGALLLAAATAFAVQRLGQKWKSAAALPLRPLLVAAALGAASHLLLDSATSAGAWLLWPLRDTQFRLDWFSADVWLLTLLLLGLALPALLGLVAEEIGARRDDRSRRRAARVTLVACLLFAGARAYLHGEAVALLESRLYQGRTPLRWAALPVPLNPFRWEGVVETPATYELAEVRLGVHTDGRLAAERPVEHLTTVYKPGTAPALDVALATPTARLHLSRARFPQVELLPASGEGWVIRIQDLADARRWSSARRLVAQIELDPALRVVRETIAYGQ